MRTPTKQELENRIALLLKQLKKQGFDTAIIVGSVNQYYFTGTIQNGLLLLKDGNAYYFVRKSYNRAKTESPLDIVYKINSYRDMLNFIGPDMGKTFIETEIMPLAILQRIKKYFTIDDIHPIDKIILGIRAVKSEYEIELIKESARQHKHLCEHIIPGILKEGMSETDFAGKLYEQMLKMGHHGVSRFSMFQMEMIIGQFGFGESSLYPTNFDGPGGMRGMYPAVPIIGSRERLLKKGDLVFVDIGYGYMGYHSDKTQIYSYGTPPPKHAEKVHNACIGVLKKAEALLRIGSKASEIYAESMQDLPDLLSKNFMGYGERVKFLGHGVGLNIDEWPVIANKFDMPLEENMVIALEPKCAIDEVGMVGVEETYLIKPSMAECLTGGASEIIVV